MTPLVCIEYKENADYPKGNYNPGTYYPEYPFGSDEVNPHGNDVYEMIRNCLYDMGLDGPNFGTAAWNPLGQYISPGDFVIIKPNMVMHKNENKSVTENSLECLVTHPSCIRAICDYCVIATQGKGRLLIGDAPMQGCDFETLVRETNLQKVLSFYAKHGVTVELKDFRQYQSEFDKHKVIIDRKYNTNQSILVHMGDKSQHYGARCNGKYQVSDYDKQETQEFHHDDVHDYEIVKDILDADVIINFSKPKTHRLAGYTAALKNMVGITYNKACLPHRTAGSVSEGGDAYLNRSLLKKAADAVLTKKIRAEKKKRLIHAHVLRYVYGALLVTARTIGKDPYYIGSWYGNDTIWRTVCDLNYIIQYADKNGKLQEHVQRRMINFGDMIIAGEGNGPVSPEPKKMGCIVGSESATAFDAVICKLIGFNFEQIPLIQNVINDHTLLRYEEPVIVIHSKNTESIDMLYHCEFDWGWKFKAHSDWR